MDKFLKYFENRKFVQWVLYPSEDLDKYWKNHLRENPSEKDEMEWARSVILSLKSKNKIENTGKEVQLFAEIVREINLKNKKPPVRYLGKNIVTYAATLLLLVSIATSYYFYGKADQLSSISQQLAIGADQNNTQLILGDGSKVLMGEKKSEIVYQDNGGIVINNKDTIGNASNKESQKYNQLIIPFGKNSSVRLPDGTIAYLNAGSRLVYPTFFTGSKREVFLYGEGFFDVHHNKKQPFIVRTSNQEVEVLGTKFNISAYPSDQISETVLVEGKVKLTTNDFSLFNEDHILEPDQMASYDTESRKTSISKVDANKHVSWYLGYINFETLQLSSLLKRLERYYNIKIKLDDPRLGTKTLSGKLLLKDDLKTVMNVLAEAASLEITKVSNAIYVLK